MTPPAPAATVGDPARYGDERRAVVGLALASLPDEDEVRAQLGGAAGMQFPSLGESLDQLAALTREDARLGHRTLGLRLLAKLASRRGLEPLASEADRLRDYLSATVEHRDRECQLLHGHHQRDPARPVPRPGAFTGVPVEAPIRSDAPEVQELLDGLEAAAQRRAPSWRSFAPGAAAPLALSEEELGLPRCSDLEDVPVGGHDSTRVVTWFSSPKPASAFDRWTDPRTWPVDCSLFFERMEPQEPIPDGADSWTATFTEVVRISDEKVLETPLVFTRTVVGDELLALYFTMPPGVATEDLLVDTGSLVAREDPANPAAQRTLLFAEKCLRFVDPGLRSWPTLLCDLYWMELTILAALGCRHD